MKFAQSRTNPRQTRNFENEVAYTVTPEVALINMTLCSFFNDTYYETADSIRNRLSEAVAKCDPDFVKKLAVYAREKMHMRTMPIVLLCELAQQKKLDYNTVYRTIQRPDEIIELLSLYSQSNATNWTDNKKLRKISNSILKGIRKVFESGKFNEYQYAKYNTQKEITFRDAIFLTHPKPPVNDEIIKVTDKYGNTIETSKLYYNIINDSLPVPYTWETELSELGQKTKGMAESEKKRLFKEKWEELIDSGKLGYMAMLRNLCNFLIYGVSDAHFEKVRNYLVKNVKISKQFPFRYLSAYLQVRDLLIENSSMISSSPDTVGKLFDALEACVLQSVENIEGFGENEKLLIVSDVSGSMFTKLSEKSNINLFSIGLLLSLLLKSKYPSSVYGIFGDSFSVGFPVEYPDTPLRNVYDMRQYEGIVGYSTNGYKVIEWALEQALRGHQGFDKIIIFTDNQMWNSANPGSGASWIEQKWNEYSSRFPNAKLYLFNLSPYHTVPIDIVKKNVFLISGWSDEIFKIANMLEKPNEIVNVIKNYQY